MKNMQCFFQRKGAAAVLTALIFFLLVSCGQGAQELKDYDISALYGYTFYGNITSTSGTTLKPSLILYNDERADWNMSVNGMNGNQFYYYAVKDSASNYTLYWFSAADQAAALNKEKSKAALTAHIGIESPDQIVILLTGDGLTGIEAMQNTRVPMTKQTKIPHNTNAPTIAFDPSIKDVTIDIPAAALESDWGGAASYSGTFDYLLGPDGKVARGHGTCGPGITPKIAVTPDAAGTHTVKINMHRFAYTPQMGFEAFDIPEVKVLKDGAVYYLKHEEVSIQALKGDGTPITLKDLTVRGKVENDKLTLRVSFKPGNMPLSITEIFKSN